VSSWESEKKETKKGETKKKGRGLFRQNNVAIEGRELMEEGAKEHQDMMVLKNRGTSGQAVIPAVNERHKAQKKPKRDNWKEVQRSPKKACGI